MGQYHEIFAAMPDGTVETIDHYAFGAGAKLGEQCYRDSPYIAAVGLLAADRWREAKLIVVGDYAADQPAPEGMPDDCPTWYGASLSHGGDGLTALEVVDVTEFAVGLVGEAAGWSFNDNNGLGWKDIGPNPRFEEFKAGWLDMPGEDVLVAIDRGEFIRPEKLDSSRAGLVMPLAGAAWAAAVGMLAISDGHGGGDLCMEPAGRWAGSRLQAMPIAQVALTGATDVTDWVLGADRIGWIMGRD